MNVRVAGNADSTGVSTGYDDNQVVETFGGDLQFVNPFAVVVDSYQTGQNNPNAILEFYPAGQKPVGENILFLDQPYVPAPPDEVSEEVAADMALDAAMQADYEEIIAASPFLARVVERLATEPKEEEAGWLSVVSGLVNKSDILYSEIKELEASLQNHKSKRAGLESTAKSAEHYTLGNDGFVLGGDWAQQKRTVDIPQLDQSIASEEEAIESKKGALRPLLQEINERYAMQLLNDGLNEDSVLTQAGLRLAEYEFDQDALTLFADAERVAEKIGDEASVMENSLYQIKYNPSLEAKDKAVRYNGLVDVIREKRLATFSTPIIDSAYRPISLTGEDEEAMKRDLYEAYSAIGSQAVREMVVSSIEVAKYDPDDDVFVFALDKLDRAIEEASQSTHVSAGEAQPLVEAGALAMEPFVREAAKETAKADLENRRELLQGPFDRADRVEKMYGHLLDVHPEAAGDPMLSEAMGNFGAQRYFYANQRTGFAYKGVEEFFRHVVSYYPDSNVAVQVAATIQEARPDLFDRDGRYLPMNARSNIYAPDGNQAMEEMAKLNFIPGGGWETFGYDFVGSSVGAEIGMGIGTGIAGGAGAAAGAAGAAASGAAVTGPAAPVGALIGFFAGMFAGAKIQREMHAYEVGELEYQAGMAGMKLAMLKPGEGDKNVATMMGIYMISAAIGPAGATAGASMKLGQRMFNMFRPSRLRHAASWVAEEAVKVPRFGYAMYNGVRGFIGLTGRNGDNLSLRFIAEDLGALFGVGSRSVGAVLDNAEDIIIQETRSVLESNLCRVLGEDNIPVVRAVVDNLMEEPLKSSAKITKLRGLLRQASDGKISEDVFERQLAEVFGDGYEGLAGSFTDRLFQAKGATTRASQLLDALSGGTRNPEEFAARLAGVFRGGNEGETVKKLVAAIGPADAPKLLKLLQLVTGEGTEALQLERVLKSLVREEQTATKLLETFLIGPTREEAVEMAENAGKALDEHVLGDMISAQERQGVHKIIGGVLQAKSTMDRSKVITEEFFNALHEVKGADEFLQRAVGGETVDLATREGRKAAIEKIASNPERCREFVDLVLGKGLPKNEALVFKGEAKKILLSALVKPPQQAEVSKEFQHVLKDVLRPRLQEWGQTPLYEIADINARAERRVSARFLNQAVTISDDAGKEFADSLVDGMAPGYRERYGAYLDTALEKLRKETQCDLVAQVRKGMTYTPENGIFDPIVRPFNKVYDLAAGPIDKLWSKRAGIAARTILSNDPAMSCARNPRMWRRMLLRQAHLAEGADKKLAKGRLPKIAQSSADREMTGVIKRLSDANEFMMKRIFTPELSKGYRVCMPIAGVDYALSGGSIDEMSNLGIVCLLVGTDYYLARTGLGTPNSFHIITANRAAGLALGKMDADSDDLFDAQRTLGTTAESIGGLAMQHALFYGYRGMAGIPFLNIVAQVPVVGGVLNALALNQERLFGLYRGSIYKPDFVGGAGFLMGAAGLVVQTGASTAQSMLISTVTKGEKFVNASREYIWSRGFNYAVNGATVNPIGFWVNRALEQNNPNAGLTSTLRQGVERPAGIATQWLSYAVYAVFAGKADWLSKENRLIEEAKAGNKESKAEVYQLFARRHSHDILGLSDGLTQPDRALRLHNGPNFHPLEMKTWYSEEWMKFSDEKEHQGYLAELARQDPDGLKVFLDSAAENMNNPDAAWRKSADEAQMKSMYYFSIMARHFAYKARQGADEYKPFQEFIDKSPYQEYWKRVPEVSDEYTLDAEIIHTEDTGEAIISGGESLSLHQLEFGYLKKTD